MRLKESHHLEGAEIRLVDLNEHRLAMVLEWCEFARRRLGCEHRISAHTDLKEGLRGATACLTAISVGGDRLWRYDSTHPQLDGIFQAVGDTTGPGGAVRALRHAPVMRGIAQTLAEVGAPNALLLQLTNPLNALTACIDHIPGIRVYGFCHGYHDTEYWIARALGLIPLHTVHTSGWRKSTPTIRVELAGNNHFVFIDKLQIGDRIYSQKEIHELTPQIFDGPFREAVWSRYGVYVGNNARHPIEFLPGFNDRMNDFGRRWGVAPVAGEIDPLNGERHDDSEQLLQAALNEARQDISATESWNLHHSHEPIAEILAAFHTGNRLDVHLNLRNEGAIQGVADDQHLEMYCRIESGKIVRPSVSFPDGITAEISRIGQSQLLLARCCDRFDEDLLIESMKLDALMPKDEAVIRRLMREMVDFPAGSDLYGKLMRNPDPRIETSPQMAAARSYRLLAVDGIPGRPLKSYGRHVMQPTPSTNSTLNSVSWRSADASAFFTGVSANGAPFPVFGTKGLLTAVVRREVGIECAVALDPARPLAEFRDLHLRLEHVAPASDEPSGLLRGRLAISNPSGSGVDLVAAFCTGLRPSRSISLESLHLPLTAQGGCHHLALACLGENQNIESLMRGPWPGQRIAAHYLEPLRSEPRQLTTLSPLLVPLFTQMNPDARASVSMFASPELPWAAIREGSEQGESYWRLQTRVHLAPGETKTIEVFLAVHEPGAKAAWDLFHRFAAPAEPAAIPWLQTAKVHYYDFLSLAVPEGPRGGGYVADAAHFAAFGVNLATQHGYYPHWGDYIHPDRPVWRGMPADVHGGMEMSLEEMRFRIGLARRHGGRAAVYIHLVGFDDASPLWPTLREGCRIEADGTRPPFCWKGPDVLGTSRFMSISNPLWSRHLLQQARWIFELLDPDAIVVDETFAGIGYDYANGSAEPASPAAIQFFKELRALARSFGPDKAILTSDCGLSGFVLWADGEAGDHAYSSLLGHEEYRREPVRYLAALGTKRWLPCGWLWQELWDVQLDLVRKTGAGIGVANGWLDFAGLAGLTPAAREKYIEQIKSLP